MGSFTKKPHIKAQPNISKTPKISSDPTSYLDRFPSWKISAMDIKVKEPCGWYKLDKKGLHDLFEKLKSFESMRWSEILIKGKKHNHSIERNKLSKEAQKHLQELGFEDVENVVSLRLSGMERIFGILELGIMKLLWWDPKHEICQSIKKHT